MTQEQLNRANRLNSRINDFKRFKTDLLIYLEDDDYKNRNKTDEDDNDVRYIIYGDSKIKRIWWRLLHPFACNWNAGISNAPVLCDADDCHITDPETKELYIDLVAVADKWIEHYENLLKIM